MNSFLIAIFAYALTMPVSFAQSCQDQFAIDGQAAKLYSSSESMSCVVQKQRYQCDELEKELEDKDKFKIIQCDSKSLAQNSASNMSITDCVWNGLKITGDQLLDLAKLPGAIAEGIAKGFKDTQLCNQSIEKKREILQAFNLSVEDKRFQLSEQFLGQRFLEEAPCSEIEKLVSARYQNYTQTMYRNRIAAINTGKKPNDVGMSKTDGPDLMKLIKEAFHAAEVRYGCYTPKVKAEMMCSAVTSILADFALGMGVKGAIAKLTSLKALKNVKRAVAAGEKVDLKDASKLHKAERLKAAKEVLKRELKEGEAEAIMEAHGIGKGFYEYTPDDIMKKGLVLKKAGFEKAELRALMENGITGMFDKPEYRKVMVTHMKTKTGMGTMTITQEDALVAIHNLGRSSSAGYADKAKQMLKEAGFKEDQIAKILLAKSNFENGVKDTVAVAATKIESTVKTAQSAQSAQQTISTATQAQAPAAPAAPAPAVVADSLGRKAVLNNFKDDKLAHYKPSNQKEAQELMKRLEKTNKFDVQESMLADAESISKARKGIAEYEEKLAKLPAKGSDMTKKDLADKLDRAKTSLEMYQKRCKGALELYREAYNISQYMKAYETVYERGCK